MTIETAYTINQLNTAYPRATDLLKEGDDHIRMIKNTLKSTFPRVTGAVNISSDTLNLLNNSISGTNNLTFTRGFSVSGGQAVNFGGNRLQGVGRPGDTNGFNSMDHGEVMTFGHLRSLFRMMYPKGSLYITPNDSINPGSLPFFAGTAWSRHWPGRIMYSSGGGDTGWNIAPSAAGGSTSFSIGAGNLPQHTHSGSTDNRGYNQGTSGGGNHNHGFRGAGATGSGSGLLFGRNESEQPGNGSVIHGVGDHAHTLDWTHAHNFSTNGGNGLNNTPITFAPAGFGACIWIRTDDNGVGV